MTNDILYKKLPRAFSATRLKNFIDQTLPGKTIKQCQNIIRNSSVIGAFDGNKLVGIGRSLDDTVYSFITDILVHPNYRKKGVGSRIVNELCRYLFKKKIKIIHCSTSKDLVEFYKSVGFTYDSDDVTLYLRNLNPLPRTSR